MEKDNGPEIDISKGAGLYAAPKENAPFNAYMARVTKAAKENRIEEYYQNEKSKLEKMLKSWVGDNYKEIISLLGNISALEDAYRIVKKGGNSKNAIRICPKCGIEYENSAKFCRKCGQLLILMQCACGEIFLKKEDGSFDNFCMKCGKINPLEEHKKQREVLKKEQEEAIKRADIERKRKELINGLKTGDIIKFGSYPYEADGTERPIEWIILENYSDGTALVISKYGLDAVRFDGSSDNWEQSEIRQWLNNEFYKRAFKKADKSLILETRLEQTSDRMYLLSIEEAEKYFSSDRDRICLPTPYAKTNKTKTGYPVYTNADYGGSCWWWLRSPGDVQDNAALVFIDGLVISLGRSVDLGNLAVRVALKINLDNI